MVHVGDVDCAVRPQLQVDRAEQRIGPEDELRSGIDVSELREPSGLDDLRATDQASDRLGKEQVTVHVLRIAVGPHDLRAGGRGEVVQRAERLTDAAHAALHVADARRRPHGIESRLEAIVERQRPVLNRKLEVDRPALGAGVDEPHLAVIVRGQAPRRTVRRRWLTLDAIGRPAEAERVVGAVDPVVEAPDEAALLVLDVPVAADADAGIEDVPLVGHAVVVGIAVLDDVVRMRFVGEDAVLVDREDHPREQDVIDEHGMPVVDAVSLGAFPAADPARRLVLRCRIGVAHVAPEFRHVHAAVAVPLDDRGVVDVGIRGDELHAIPGGKQKRSRLFSRAASGDRRLRREVRAGHVLDETAASAGLSGPGFAGSLRRLGLRLRSALKVEEPTSSNRRYEYG